MESDNTYAKVYSEVYDILKYCNENLKYKVSKKFIKYIYENRDKEYITNIIPYIPLEQQNILPETRAYVALIYINYFADENEKIEFFKNYKLEQDKIEKEKTETYNPSDIFKKRNEITQQIKMEDNSTNLPATATIGIFSKIIAKLKKIFRKNKY